MKPFNSLLGPKFLIMKNISFCTYIQYMRCIRPLEVGNHKYIFLYDFEPHKMLLERMDYLHKVVDILFVSLKMSHNRIFHQKNILHRMNNQLLYKIPMDFLVFQEDSSR